MKEKKAKERLREKGRWREKVKEIAKIMKGRMS